MTLFATLLVSVFAFLYPNILCYAVSLLVLGAIYFLCPVLYWIIAAAGVLYTIWKLLR